VLRALAILTVLAGGVLADPLRVRGEPVDPIAIVGRYQAKVTWTHCTPPGARTGVIDLDQLDSRFELQLEALRDGLPPVVVAGDARKLSGRSGDVEVSMMWGTRAIGFAIVLDSGCTAQGTLRRETTKIPACDELVALAHIEAGCTAVAADARLEDLTALDRERIGWGKTSGKRRRVAAATCSQRVATLRPALIDAACVAVPVEEAPTMLAECRDLATRIARLSACRTLPDTVRGQLRDMLGQTAVHLVDATEDEVDVARQICLRQDEVLRELSPRLGCP
jgi:hypothetical protein